MTNTNADAARRARQVGRAVMAVAVGLAALTIPEGPYVLAGLLFVSAVAVRAFEAATARRAAAGAGDAFRAATRARPPRDGPGPSVTLWPDGADVAAFIEYADGRVDDIAIPNRAASFAAIVELLYRLSADDIRIVAVQGGPAGRRSVDLRVGAVLPEGVGTWEPWTYLRPVLVADRNADIAARAAAFAASTGAPPPGATD